MKKETRKQPGRALDTAWELPGNKHISVSFGSQGMLLLEKLYSVLLMFRCHRSLRCSLYHCSTSVHTSKKKGGTRVEEIDQMYKIP
jgi:hypothetical protein